MSDNNRQRAALDNLSAARHALTAAETALDNARAARDAAIRAARREGATIPQIMATAGAARRTVYKAIDGR